MSTILDKIVANRRRQIAAAQAARPQSQLEAALEQAPPPRSFLAPLHRSPPVQLIAEIKKASPSQGVIRQDFHPAEIARAYQQHGAACLSVLTEETYFLGGLPILEQVRAASSLPLLRKDFILDHYQLLEARAAGADAVLLIAECLDDQQLRSLHQQTLQLDMTPLVEFYQPENLPRALDCGARLIGVNNRDLRTFATNIQHTIRMRRRIPHDRLVVAESGVHSRQDLRRLEDAGVNAVLVGQHLMASPDIGAAVDQLLGHFDP